ncbi:histone deacetylase SIR2 [Toxoplasma gondii RUB]|uniref:Histone deacetylase SIR2 n=13 Tax=Toxoplasma gondii TaxID=5811 RepID=B9PMV3_TOXGV|nr:histone deacetylase SIR2 [Toxoplasma gondii GT1]ESS32672.1 histone deacetylase SIR2 [Toxoplasma gondii VEG]KAF4640738.1 histone deacetylase SIR2 [Toxoplasma gondii]KFG42435.1 histone deacetylase SIR2 [Toxoplasma gondii p89]KFG45176.1 histone deacetylase SIR2 [Toxoplasma gondii GAB2-2007-GAL-DOM2]KFG51934.1 histone deacetylase SIR2 [Toxoplasma gondii FOU]KFG60979.1 histone deacetylase SIR2 [Toxoplasma gondii RUB]KFH09904.1 histone deacetylase SIR2 [Toxoplasma gondii MAS]KFH13008.1 histone
MNLLVISCCFLLTLACLFEPHEQFLVAVPTRASTTLRLQPIQKASCHLRKQRTATFSHFHSDVRIVWLHSVYGSEVADSLMSGTEPAGSDYHQRDDMGQAATYFQKKNTTFISFEDLADDVRKAKYVVALTGAGVSAESGIPTFRDPSDGLWKKYDPTVYATIWGFWRYPHKIWELLLDFLRTNDPMPNAAHVALTDLQRLGYLKFIVTQNVDNLHQDSGSTNVIEYHGSLLSATCRQCGKKMRLSKSMLQDENFAKDLPPKCACGGIFKPDVILFGEGIPANAVRDANREVDKCDLLLVVGTSASVSPASDLPYRAMRGGAKVVEVNLETTGLTNRISDKFVQGRASQLAQTVKALQRR